jgi:MoxR-like ATPase
MEDRPADDVWLEIREKCRELMESGDPIPTLATSTRNWIREVGENFIVRQSEKPHSDDGTSRIDQSMIVRIWDSLRETGESHYTGGYRFAWALVGRLIDGVGFDADPFRLVFTDRTAAMRPFLRAQRQVIVVYVPESGRVNLGVGLDRGTWGFKEDRSEYRSLRAGDWVLLGTGFSGGSPRVREEEWTRGSLRRLIVGRLTSGVFESREKLWPDEGGSVWYPFRFSFEDVGEVNDVELSGPELSPEISEAFRLSGIRSGSGIVRSVGGALLGRFTTRGTSAADDLPKLLAQVLHLQSSWTKDATTAPMTERAILVKTAIPSMLGPLLPADRVVKGSGGHGSAARVPWVRIYDAVHSPKATEGWYVVYLFAADGSAVHLSLNQGAADPATTSTGGPAGFKSKPASEVSARVQAARALLQQQGAVPASAGGEMKLADPGGRGDDYQLSNVFAFEYPTASIPSTAQLNDDLDDALAALAILYSHDWANETDDDDGQQNVWPTFDLDLIVKHVDAHGLILDDDVLRAVLAAINSEKHVVLTGPPGTAKTTLAEVVASAAAEAGQAKGYVLTTATSDWTTFETIGGLRPTSASTLEFGAGQFVQAIREDRWLVVDELNRANFDRAFGQLFTLLSGQSVSLPYTDAISGLPIRLAPEGTPAAADASSHVIVLPRSWRLIATMNVFDKSLLFEMSYALMRRFAFIEVPAPADDVYRTLISAQLQAAPAEVAMFVAAALDKLLPLRNIKELGPALFIDMARFARERLTIGKTDTPELTYQLFYSYLLPQFEGIDDATALRLYQLLSPAIGATLGSRLRRDLHQVLGVELPTAQMSTAPFDEDVDSDES